MSNAHYPYQYENSISIKGHLGADPVSRVIHPSSGDKTVCNFSVATNKVIGDKTYTEWHRVTCYGNLAEAFTEAAREGDFVNIKGEMRSREFLTAEDKAANRKPRRVTEIIAHEAYVLFKKDKTQGQAVTKTSEEAPPALDPVDETYSSSADAVSSFIAHL